MADLSGAPGVVERGGAGKSLSLSLCAEEDTVELFGIFLRFKGFGVGISG